MDNPYIIHGIHVDSPMITHVWVMSHHVHISTEIHHRANAGGVWCATEWIGGMLIIHKFTQLSFGMAFRQWPLVVTRVVLVGAQRKLPFESD